RDPRQHGAAYPAATLSQPAGAGGGRRRGCWGRRRRGRWGGRGRCARGEPAVRAGRAGGRDWEKTPMRWIVLALLVGGTVTLPAAPAAAQQAPLNPCDGLTAPGADPCQPVPVTQPGLPGLLERFLTPDQCGD